jgi:Ca-activated chloride channel family protein
MGWVLAVLLLSLFAAAPAAAQQEDRSVLLILDSSKSMNEPAESGQTRLDAAKSATKDLLDAVPDDAAIGLRVYGSKVSEASRAEGCRDTELVIPVEPLDRSKVESVVDGLEGKGRTPIGRSLLAAADDLPAGGRRTVILVSDGGDNCAPPDPCKAAAEVSRQGIDMTIQVVGLQVNDRVREQLKCIADAGGGSYVDARDSESLKAELAAAFARAFRFYEPTGKPIEGGPAPESAAAAQPGQYLDDLRPEQARWYSVALKKGQTLRAAATFISPPPPEPALSALIDVELRDPQGATLFKDTTNYRTTGGRTPIGTVAASMESPAPADGAYRFGVSVRGDAVGFASPLPVEVVFGVGGAEPAADDPQADAAPGRAPAKEGSDVPELAGVGGAGLLLGAIAGFIAMRRRRA